MSSKELPTNDGPPGVFHMFDKDRTFFFESDISALPHPPLSHPNTSVTDTMTQTMASAGFGFYPLRKRQSMPSLTVVGSGNSSSLGT
jgi:hypothetical protein